MVRGTELDSDRPFEAGPHVQERRTVPLGEQIAATTPSHDREDALLYSEDSLREDLLAVPGLPGADVDAHDPGRALFLRTVERERVFGSAINERPPPALESRVKNRKRRRGVYGLHQ